MRTQTPTTTASLGDEPTDPRQAEARRALQAAVDDVGRRARGIAATEQRRDGLHPGQLQAAPAPGASATPDAYSLAQQPARTGG